MIPSVRLKEIAKAGSRGVLSSFLAKSETRRVDFEVRVKYLRSVPRMEWHIKQFRSLGKGLFEIKWISEGVQCRAMGFDLDGFFTIVKCCTHKDNVYDPPSCIKRAHELVLEVTRRDWDLLSYEP